MPWTPQKGKILRETNLGGVGGILGWASEAFAAIKVPEAA
jgi:hypothetical protein